MEYYSTFLELYISIMLGTVAFMTIVATLRQTFEQAMPPHQYLIIRFLVEVGMCNVFLAMLALALINSNLETSHAFQLTYYAFSLYAAPYLIFHTYRRSKQDAPTPGLTKIVMVGYFVVTALLLATTFGYIFNKTGQFIIAYLLWMFLAHITIFFVFLGTFFEVDSEKIAKT